MSKENVSIKTFLQWRGDVKGNGTVLWTLARDAPTMEYKREAKRKNKKHNFVCVK